MESDKTKIEFGSAASAPRLDYNLNFATGGSYYVWVRGIGFDGNSDSVHLGVNGVPQISAGNIAIRREGVIWSRFSTEIGASATLFFNAGAQTISLFMRESGTSVDAIKLTTDKAYRPDQAASIPTISLAPNTPSSGTITEGSDDGITYTFARSTAFGDLPVAVSLFSGTAIADDYTVSGDNVDYDAATGGFVVTFKGTETQASFTVHAKSDVNVEGDETLTLAIDESSGDSYRVAGGTETTTTIKDLPVVTIHPASESGVTIREGESGKAAFIVKRSNANGPLSVTVRLPAVLQGTVGIAAPVADYSIDGYDLGSNHDEFVVSWVAHDASLEKTIYLSAAADALDEGDETVTASLYLNYEDKSHVFGSAVSVEVTIADDTAVLKSLTVKDPAHPDNAVTDDGNYLPGNTFYIEQNANGKATIDLSGVVTPDVAAAKAKALWRIDEPYSFQSQGDFTASSNSVELTVVDNNRVWNVKAGADNNGNGNLEAAEVTRTVGVTVCEIGDLTAYDNGSPFSDLSVTVTDDEPEGDLYVFETGNGYGVVDFVSEVDPDEDEVNEMVLWQMSGDDALPEAGNLLGLGDIFLTPTAANREYVFELGFDNDNDGSLDEGEVDRTVNITVVLLHVEEVNFKGGGNHNIKINATTDLGHPVSGAGEDVEWVRTKRDQPLTSAAWANNQIGPALNVLGNALQVEVTVSVLPTTVTTVKIRGTNGGAYGNFGAQQVTLNNGTGKATFTSTGTTPAGPAAVGVDDFSIQWALEKIEDLQGAADLDKSDHRVYSVLDAPVNSQATAWAEVLEFSTNLAAGATDADTALTALTNGIYFSQWNGIRNQIRFNAPTARHQYNPGKIFGIRAAGIGTAANTYSMTGWIAALNTGGIDIQQCAENADVLAVLSHSLGVNMQPLWFTATGGLPNATYLPAGTTVNRSDAFNYHQVGFFSGKVYDPSAGYAVPANPATPFTPAPYILGYDAYLNTAFGTTRDDVNTVRVTAITAT